VPPKERDDKRTEKTEDGIYRRKLQMRKRNRARRKRGGEEGEAFDESRGRDEILVGQLI